MSAVDFKEYATSTDQKLRWGGLLEIPWLSTFQRACLDGGRVSGLRKALAKYPCPKILDVGCGYGECSKAHQGMYFGVDNSFPRAEYGAKRYRKHKFLAADARQLPFKPKSFDMVTLIDTSHHLSDQELDRVLEELKRVSKKFIVISDPVVTDGQSAASAFFYRLDRGACFRRIDQMKKNLAGHPSLRLLDVVCFKTFPGFYIHAAFILEKV